MRYINRISDEDFFDKLNVSAAVFLIAPKSLNIITGTGMTHRRPDGINVISLASFGK